jgi:carbonic anhydrase/acetyltransferase-like protein (isoleucine patch superfamily)
MIHPYQGVWPDIHPSVFLTPDVTILGDVSLAEDVNVWFGSVIRGDVHRIRIGARTNVQDLCMLHVTWKKHALTIGADVTIGHSVTLHGCTLHDACLIGMGARVLDAAVVESESLVAAGAVVGERFVVPEGHLVAGVPARVIRPLRPEEREKIRQSARNYLHYVEQYRTHGDLARGIGFDDFLARRAAGTL